MEPTMSEFAHIKVNDIIGVDQWSGSSSVARVTAVGEYLIEAQVISGLYPLNFDKFTGVSHSHDLKWRIGFAGELPKDIEAIVVDLEEKASQMSIADYKRYCDDKAYPVLEFMAIEHDESLGMRFTSEVVENDEATSSPRF
jgi:hypothetical protein